MPETVLTELFDILTGILESLQTITNSSQEFKDTQHRIIKIFLGILIKDPSQAQNLEIDKEFCDACDIQKLLKSHRPEVVEDAINFSMLLLHHEPTVTMSDLVGYDFESRDIIMKRQALKMWDSINDLGGKYSTLQEDIDNVISEKVDDEVELMQDKFNKMLQNAIKSQKVYARTTTGKTLDDDQHEFLTKLQQSNVMDALGNKMGKKVRDMIKSNDSQ